MWKMFMMAFLFLFMFMEGKEGGEGREEGEEDGIEWKMFFDQILNQNQKNQNQK